MRREEEKRDKIVKREIRECFVRKRIPQKHKEQVLLSLFPFLPLFSPFFPRTHTHLASFLRFHNVSTRAKDHKGRGKREEGRGKRGNKAQIKETRKGEEDEEGMEGIKQTTSPSHLLLSLNRKEKKPKETNSPSSFSFSFLSLLPSHPPHSPLPLTHILFLQVCSSNQKQSCHIHGIILTREVQGSLEREGAKKKSKQRGRVSEERVGASQMRRKEKGQRKGESFWRTRREERGKTRKRRRWGGRKARTQRRGRKLRRELREEKQRARDRGRGGNSPIHNSDFEGKGKWIVGWGPCK